MDDIEMVSAPEVATPEPPRYPYIAPTWHTLVLVLVLGLFSWASSTAHHDAEKAGRLAQYIATMAWEWILFGYVWFGIRRRGIRLRDLVGGRWDTVEDFLLDVALAAGFWIVALVALSALGFAMHLTGADKLPEIRRQLGFLVPQTRVEVYVWFGLSMTAGICEEVVFRGYLQKQFAALTRNVWLGIILSGIIFGGGHGYQGPKRMILIAIYGMMFGVLAHARKSLRPGMMAHATHDIFTGMVLRVLAK